MGKIQDLQLKISQLKDQLNSTIAKISETKSAALGKISSIATAAESTLSSERAQIGADAAKVLNDDMQQPFFANAGAWDTYKPIIDISAASFPDRILVGKWVDRKILNGATPEIAVPAYIPFFSDQHAIIIDVDNDTEEKGLGLMKSIIERIYTIIPHYAKFTLIDPVTNGAVFPMKRDIEIRQQDSDIYHLLDAIVADSAQITTAAALTREDYFGSRVESITMNEKFEIICAANFPHKTGYDSRTIDRLVNLGNIGYVSGKYLIIVNNVEKEEELPRDFNMKKFENAIHIDMTTVYNYYANYDSWKDDNGAVVFIPDEECEPVIWKKITDRIKNDFKPKEKKITWEEYIDVSDDKVWSGSSREIIETPIGDANGKTLSIWFGKKDGNNCAHGMLAATTGAGKSNFYHALILGLARRYSPEELRMYLIDGKNGVEFEVYKSFPHAEVVSLKSSSELAGSVLSELVSETKRRNEIFKEAGVNSFEDFRKNPENKMPRVLLLIDEYQVLFEGDDAVEASKNLHSLTAQARSAGIHLLLGSQHFGAPNMLNKDIIFTNIQLFIAMKMTMDDRLSLTMFGKEGKELIKKCELPGQIVINQNGGGDGFNQLGKVAFVEKKQKAEIIETLTQKAIDNKFDNTILRTIIFEGDSAPDLDANPELLESLEKPVLDPNALQKKARIQERDGGYGKVDWNQSEKPMICWMGQEMTVYGQFSAVIRRRKMENMLILGDRNPYRYGMLVSSLFSLVATHKPGDIDFYIYDRSAVGTDWNPYLGAFSEDVLRKARYNVQFATKVKDIKAGITEVMGILKKRLSLDQDERMDLKPLVLVLTEPEEIEDLNLVVDKNGFKTDSELGKDLEFIYTNGSSAGVHLTLSSSGVIPLLNVLQKKQLPHFRHRVSLQISEQESFDLFGARVGSQLQMHGDEPVVAFYKDMNGNSQVKFKPYSVTDKGFENQFAHLKKLVLSR